jgi:hypothetical protein
VLLLRSLLHDLQRNGEKLHAHLQGSHELKVTQSTRFFISSATPATTRPKVISMSSQRNVVRGVTSLLITVKMTCITAALLLRTTRSSRTSVSLATRGFGNSRAYSSISNQTLATRSSMTPSSCEFGIISRSMREGLPSEVNSS